ncbi:hypothetical protein MKW98_013434 [Papaver atlanticum]|uniref:Uncharacterized protein n=1 Tax=Papaver atlanticum TaxID=357466 RepID=A0AAD4XLK1_9MAGN|nr:hypothetical protein MKW98_013434 [Papaver atlanticum]
MANVRLISSPFFLALLLLLLVVFVSDQGGVHLVNAYSHALPCSGGDQCSGRKTLGDGKAPDYDGCGGPGWWYNTMYCGRPIPYYGCKEFCARAYGRNNVVGVGICRNWIYGDGFNWCFCCGGGLLIAKEPLS